jgi:hypothetical protein
MEVNPNIALAIEHSVAASRWRIAARFEGPQTAARFRRQAEERRAAATACIRDFAGAAGVQTDRPRSASRPLGGG